MRKIDVTTYKVTVIVDDSGTKATKDYGVKDSIELALFHPDLRLSARELFQNDKIAQKVKAATDNVLLEESEYASLKKAFETIQGFRQQDLEMVRRILEAPEVAVEAKP